MTRDTGASEPVGTLITDNAVRQCADRAPGGSEPFSTYSASRRGRILSGNDYQDSTK